MPRRKTGHVYCTFSIDPLVRSMLGLLAPDLGKSAMVEKAVFSLAAQAPQTPELEALIQEYNRGHRS